MKRLVTIICIMSAIVAGSLYSLFWLKNYSEETAAQLTVIADTCLLYTSVDALHGIKYRFHPEHSLSFRLFSTSINETFSFCNRATIPL